MPKEYIFFYDAQNECYVQACCEFSETKLSDFALMNTDIRILQHLKA